MKDLYDNAENFDSAVNDRAIEHWNDRLGRARLSWHGMEEAFQRFLVSSGYQDLGEYAAGLEITTRNQIFRKDGELWRASGSLDLPYTTSGDWGSEGSSFVSVGDAALRQQLAASGVGLGDALIAVLQPYADAVPLTQHFHNSMFLTPFHFGAAGDGEADDTEAINKTWTVCAAVGVMCRMTKAIYHTTGDLLLRSNLHVKFDNGAWIMPSKWAPSGAFITNVNVADPLSSNVENVLIENPHVDGANVDTAQLGNSNAIGVARGAKNVRILGGVIKNIPYSFNNMGGAGGKAVGVEQGIDGFIATGYRAENCGLAIFLQGVPGAWSDGDKKNAVGIQFSNVHAENCEALAFVAGVTTDSTSPTGDPSISLALITDCTYHNCGHAPYRPVVSDHKKSGVIVIGEGQNVRIDNIKGYNDPDYPMVNPGYPTDPGLIGYGLTGPIGAVIWGWGRNISIGSVEHHGNVDSIVHIERARAHGDDAAPSGTPINVFRFDVSRVKHYGSAQYALTQGIGTLGPDTTMTGKFCIYADTLSDGLIGADFGQTLGVTLRVVDAATNAVVEGTPPDLRNFRNSFAGLRPEQWLSSLTVRDFRADQISGAAPISIPTDTVVVIPRARRFGFMHISSDASGLRALVDYRCSATGAQTNGPTISNFSCTTGVLTGTTGAPNTFTFSADNAGNLYLENRRGGTITVYVSFPG